MPLRVEQPSARQHQICQAKLDLGLTRFHGPFELELAARKIEYVILTGDTTDRETVVRNFQECKAPLPSADRVPS